jgi:hypothetical protein
MPFTRTALAATAALALTPAAAHAATLTTAPCVIERLPMTIQGTGWGPGSAWSVQATGIFDSGTADAAGNFISAPTAPTVGGDDDTFKPVKFTLTGQQDGQDVASTEFKVVDFLVRPNDPSGDPTKKTLWHFSGFTPGRRVYVHVRRKGKTYTQRAGVAKSPCGTLKKRLRRLPAWPKRKIAYGTYKIAIDSRKKYAPTDNSYPQYTASITIRKVFL